MCGDAQTAPAIAATLVVWLALPKRRQGSTRHQEQAMSMNKDQVKGRVKEAEGKIKEAAGKLVGNDRLQAKGKVEQILGHAQAKFGDVKEDLRDAKNSA
jgi:uncharacterized protein YjbJ (UPF0337 family)